MSAEVVPEPGGAGAVDAHGQTGPPVEAEPAPRSAHEIEEELRGRLLAPRPAPSIWGWLGPVLVAALAAVLRLVDLGRPHSLVFDETYYVKDAYSLLQLGYEGRWGEGADARFAAGDFAGLTDSASYVVHPPLGKWLIAAGLQVLGAENAAGWRLGTAVAGIVTVFLVARLARRLFASTLLGCTAGLFLALDGMHIVESRIGLLDVFLCLFAVAAFGAVVLDRERSRARLVHLTALDLARSAQPGERPTGPWGPRLGIRWWLVAAGVLCGLAIGVKWSGAYVLAVLGILTVAWDLSARRAAGVRLWAAAGLLRDGPGAFVSLVPVAALTYLATWTSWFTHPQAYQRQWAAEHPESQRPWLPDALDSLLEFHRMVWQFHTGLSTPHGYEAGPLGWIVQWRPTSFFWGTVSDPEIACGSERCVQAITSVGNPVVWWGGAVALVMVTSAAVLLRDWRAWTVLSGYAALWLPWFLYPDRTTFTFYAVAFAPFVALALTYAVGMLLGFPAEHGPPLPPPRWRDRRVWVAVALVVLVAAAAVFFWPVWTAQVMPYDQWHLRMWFQTWV